MELPVSAQLVCTTTHGDNLRGNLVAMDDRAKVVIIKESDDSSSSGSVHIINLHHLSELNISDTPASINLTTPLPDINLQKVERRLEQNVEAKWREVKSRGVNVSEEAQQLFDSLSKLYNETRWEGDVIVVLGDVRISPPYSPDSCTGISSTLVARIEKLVKRFQDDKTS